MSRTLKDTGSEDIQFVRPKELLGGKKEIAAFVGRGWHVVSLWIKEKGFPATKLNGRWESDAELIRQWRKEQIKRD